jgi:predicted nucleotidyltransferase
LKKKQSWKFEVNPARAAQQGLGFYPPMGGRPTPVGRFGARTPHYRQKILFDTYSAARYNDANQSQVFLEKVLMRPTRTVTNPKFQALADKILPVLQPYKIKRVAIFGSIVRGEDGPDSDVDILVSLRPPGERPVIGLKWFAIAEELSSILERPVDLVTEDGLSRYIRPYVEKEMVILYEAE